ncbi:MAG: hypothetical protein WAZ34_01635 [Rhodocyclaceae bacterium]
MKPTSVPQGDTLLRRSRFLLGCLSCAVACFLPSVHAAAPQSPAKADLPPQPRESGIVFDCPAERRLQIEREMHGFLAELQIAPALYSVDRQANSGKLRFTLNTPHDDTSTLDFTERPEFGIPAQRVRMPSGPGKEREVSTVSQKEIVLALMQHGRLTGFSGDACAIEALRDHVGIRQNIVAWAEVLQWGWPNGRPSQWNEQYWRGATPKNRRLLRQAVNDAFINQEKYAIGCYAAARLVIAQGILDYYHRIRKDAVKARIVKTRLLKDKEPLVDIEPARMWSFETDFNPQELERPGKIMRITDGVADRNFVPGDWPHFQNTDPVSYEKTGYEGSNPIYLGRNRFVDYYNDHDHFYTFEEKLDEVYQWRNKVFNRSRDKDLIVPLSEADYARLHQAPEKGGLLMTLRSTPYYFGFEGLPAIGP